MTPPIPQSDFPAINHSQINRLSNPFYQLTNIPFNKLTKKCKTNPIFQIPKNALTPYPTMTNVERRATSDDKNKPKTNPIKPNFSPKTQVQTQKQTQFKAKLRQSAIFG
jgi:hypothetical protein